MRPALACLDWKGKAGSWPRQILTMAEGKLQLRDTGRMSMEETSLPPAATTKAKVLN
jgi:hypothetical protein